MTLQDSSQLAREYDESLRALLDHHAPLVKIKITLRTQVPWFTNEATQMKHQLRQAENTWKRNKCDTTWAQYTELRNTYKNHLDKSKFQYINDKIEECGTDAKQLFSIVAKLTGQQKVNPLPEGDDSQLAEDFSSFFHEKVENIRQELLCREPYEPPCVEGVPLFNTFPDVTVDTVTKLIGSSKPTTCFLDPVPSILLKQNADIIAPLMTHIINTSFHEGHFPTRWKSAIVTPLLKKTGLHLEKKNYRPVSNVSFISKIAEKSALESFIAHLEVNQLLPQYQSAYRRNYSTETLLVKVHNDILQNMEAGHINAFTAVDLSAAFDLVDHEIMMDVLNKCFNTQGAAASWWRSYLADRKMSVKINDYITSPITVNYSVPQGSVSGPVLFTCFASTLADHLKDRPEVLIGYADDHSLYGHFEANNPVAERHTIASLEESLTRTSSWMLSNYLKMNNDKSEFILFGSSRLLPNCNSDSIQVGGREVSRGDSLKLLGVMLDQSLTFKKHIADKARKAASAVFRIRKLRPYLSKERCLQLTNALVLSHMDYSNALFVNLPVSTLKPLQRIQNFAAKTVTKASRYSSATLALKECHMLPIKHRILFKLGLLVFRALNGLAPRYLSELLSEHQARYRTRLSSQNCIRLCVPLTKKRTFADRSFSVAGPKFWNSLPMEIRQCSTPDHFKKSLKTYLFLNAF
jgi:hypothetical protein